MIRNLLAAIVVLICISGCGQADSRKEQPLIQKGELNLEGWRLQTDGPVRLSGDWEFYWNKFLKSRDFSMVSPPEKTGYIKIPGMWNDFEQKGETLPGIGFATLRMRLKLDQAPLDLAFKLQDVYSAYTIFVNGKEIGSVGRVSERADNGRDQNLPQVFSFSAESKDLEVILQISNHTLLYGGAPQVIFFGLKDDLQKQREKSLALDLFVIGGILIMGLYHFGLYFLRRSEVSTLYFMLHCFSIVLYGSVTGEGLLPLLFPAIGMEAIIRIVLFSAASGMLWLILFIHSIVPHVFPRGLLRFSNATMAISCISALVKPLVICLWVHVVFQVVMVAVVLCTIGILMWGAIQKQFGSMILLFGFLILAIASINDILYFHAIIETVYLAPIGLFFLISSQAFLLSVKFNKAFNLVEVFTDELDVKNRELSRLDRLKDDFLSNTSHELRTPLSGIIGIAESVVAGAAGKISSETRARLSLIISSGKRLSNLINDILDFSRLRHDNLHLRIESVDLNEQIEMVSKLMAPLAESKGLSLNYCVPENQVAVKADRNRLHQILINLIGNAIKYTQTGGVTLKVSTKPKFATVTVTDTGVGIPVDKQKKIFESFEQLEDPNVREQSGAGLGLAITQKLVELHRGEIELQSRPGKGSDFSFSLPLSDLPITETDLKPVLSERNEITSKTIKNSEVLNSRPIDTGQEMSTDSFDSVGKQKACDYPELETASVLVVDDDPVNLTVIHDFLSLSGAVVKTATSGSESLAILDSWKPDVVLLDIMMPRMSGFETAEKIRKIHKQDELPIIFLTAKDQDNDLMNGFAAQANDYLVKPVSRTSLCTRISFHISMARLALDLKSADERMRQIIDNTVEGIFQISNMNRIVFANQAMAGLFGYSTTAEMLASNLQLTSLLVNSDDIDLTSQALKKEAPFSKTEVQFVRQDGSTFWGTFSIQTLHGTSNQPVLIQGMIFDTSASREKAIAEKKREIAEKANLTKSEFLANISHELRTPMQGVLGFARLGVSRGGELSPDKMLGYFKEIYNSGNRLLNLLNDLLDLSKLESNAVDYSFTSEKLSSVIAIVLSELYVLIDKKGLQIDFDIPTFDDTATFDVDKIGQVVRNLLGNAIKFSNDNDAIEIHLTKKDNHLRFAIADNGIGIPEDELDTIFDKFVQSSKHKSGAGGTGLGLAICQKIIEDHQGEIWAENNWGGGSIFSFSIPLSLEN